MAKAQKLTKGLVWCLTQRIHKNLESAIGVSTKGGIPQQDFEENVHKFEERTGITIQQLTSIYLLQGGGYAVNTATEEYLSDPRPIIFKGVELNKIMKRYKNGNVGLRNKKEFGAYLVNSLIPPKPVTEKPAIFVIGNGNSVKAISTHTGLNGILSGYMHKDPASYTSTEEKLNAVLGWYGSGLLLTMPADPKGDFDDDQFQDAWQNLYNLIVEYLEDCYAGETVLLKQGKELTEYVDNNLDYDVATLDFNLVKVGNTWKTKKDGNYVVLSLDKGTVVLNTIKDVYSAYLKDALYWTLEI